MNASSSLPIFPQARVNPFDPAPGYARLREQAGIVRAAMRTGKGNDVWLVTRYREACQVLKDTRFSSDCRLEGFPLVRAFTTMIRMDPPQHTAVRQMLISEFTAQRMEGWRQTAQELTDGLLDDAMNAAQPVDLVQALAMPLPSLVICRLLGVPYSHHARLQECTATALRFSSTEEQVDAAIAELGDHLEKVVADKMRAPGDDLLSRLVRDHVQAGTCTHDTAVDLARLMFVAGHVTTVNMIGLGVLTLLEHHDQVQRLFEGDSAAAVVEELLRYLTIAGSVGRVATEDVEVGGTRIRRGDGLMVLLSVANRDPRIFDSPDVFNTARDQRHNVAFGHGPHQCIGKSLARLELQVALPTLFRRFPRLRAAIPVEDVAFRHEMRIYGVHELPVLLQTRSPAAR